MRRGFSLLLLMAMLAVLTPRGAAAAPDGQAVAVNAATASAKGYCATPEEARLLKLVNDYRADNGLAPFVLSPTLGAAARHHSESMATFNYFDPNHDLHFEGPEADQTVTWQQNIADHGYPGTTHTSRAENLAAGYETAAETLAQWEASPSHNAHLLSATYQAIGIGEAFNPDAEYRWYWTVTFGSVVDATAGSCDATASGGTAAAGSELAIRSSGRNGSSTASDVAYDGDPNTAWYTTKARTPESGYVWFDLGSVKTLSAIDYLFSEKGGAAAFEIQVSTDRENWTTVAALGDPPIGTWQTQEWAGEARYVRFAFTNPDKAKVLGYLAEVKILA